MEEPYTEGVAIHGGPEPCVGDPRGRSEALDRGTHRPAIEPRNGVNRGADVVMTGGRQHRWRRYARVAGGPREVGEPVHVRNLHAREPGDPTIALPPGTVRAARGRLRPHARDVRSWEVGLPRSTGEAVEQGRCAAAEMVEGRGQREGNAASTTCPGHRAGTGACQACWTVCVGSCWSEPALDPSEEPSAVVPHAGICAGGRPKGRSLPRPSVLVRARAKR